jgi:hypothetical protein
MAAVPQTNAGAFAGAQIALVSNDPLWFVLKVDSNLFAEFTLYHQDAGSNRWNDIAWGRGSMSVRVDQAVQSLRLDALGWIILCSPLNAGTFPVYVQLFQGTEATGFVPVSRIAQYDVTVGPSNALQPVNDTIKLV